MKPAKPGGFTGLGGIKGDVLLISRAAVAYLDAQLLAEGGHMKCLPAEFYHGLPKDHIRAWAHIHARYGIPTVELIDWLRGQINGRTALEIGAGAGDLGYHLGIPMTDSYQQVKDPLTVLAMKLHDQPAIKPPPDVEEEEAEAAVIRRKPQVVIGSWITERFQGNLDVGGNILGPMEENIIANCETYIVIGNKRIHGRKRILAHRHQTYQFPWIISRASVPGENVIYVWSK